MNNPFIQIKALHEYEKASKGPIKLYPSLELVRLEQKFFNKKKGKVLEYGFGSGCNTIHLLKCGYKLFGIDVSKGMLNVTSKRLKKAKLKKNCNLKILGLNDKKLPYKKNFFDYIIAMSVLSLLGSEKKIKNLLKEFKRVLKPNGKLILDINDHKSEFALNKKQIEKNVFLTKPVNDKEVRTFCLESEKDFKKIVSPYFSIKDIGFSSHKLFGREITEFIISAQKRAK